MKQKGFFMKQVKEAIEYWTNEMKEGKYLGQGIRIAVLDTGIILHPDFDRRIIEFTDFVNRRRFVYDDSGHGTHVAGILAGSGKMSDGVYGGMAPKSELIIGKVLDRQGNGSVRNVMEGIRWILALKEKRQIRIVNISVGAKPQLDSMEEKNLLSGVEMLWDAGLIVVVSAGNYGPKEGSIAVPGSSRKVITVGAVGNSQIVNIHPREEWNYSGRGPTNLCVVKPDLVAPGTQVVSCNGQYLHRWKKPYIAKSGTSMATPVAAGAIACLLSKYPDMTNVEVKLRLRESCKRENSGEQGWGMLNMKNLMK